ncbi:MAG: YbaB/EbfC family nucleoid-associated protein [Nitrospinae bacterium]|nr:YbaB/EbfC family nucleoid-associated protein [Nitrospinota bacterium]
MRMLGDMLQKAQKMKAGMDEARAKMKNQTVEAESANGAVRVVASCDKQIVSITVNQERAAASGRSVEELITEAANAALQKAEAALKEELSKAMGAAGLSLPGLF